MEREKRKMCKKDAQSVINDYLMQNWTEIQITGLYPCTVAGFVWVVVTIQDDFKGEDNYRIAGEGKVKLFRGKETDGVTEEMVTISGDVQIASNDEKEPVVEKVIKLIMKLQNAV